MGNDKSYLTISQVDMTFSGARGVNPVLKGISLEVKRGEYISLIGHSGCGKSTVLNIVAGLLKATSGGVIVDGREVNEPGPDRAVVFQNHSLLPWLTVYQNVELAVEKIFKTSKSAAERREWILHNLAMVNMSHALNRLPSEISGGMKQRVGIARALAMEPKVLLLDEPFGALDALTRAHLQDEVIRIQSELGNTVLMITHDVDEAVLLSDRVVMMTNGPAAEIGQIMEVKLPRPRNRIALAEDPVYNHCRQEILSFLYEKQRKVEPIATPRSMRSAAKDKEQAIA
jgi:nitrate/nitrite transport system ATP-binding protein